MSDRRILILGMSSIFLVWVCLNTSSLAAQPAGVIAQPAGVVALTADQQAAVGQLPVVPPNLNRGFALIRNEGKSVRATLGLRVTTPSFEAEQWVFALPVPPDLPGQTLLESEFSPSADLITDGSALRRPVRRSVIKPANVSMKRSAGVSARYDLKLYSRSLEFDRRPGHSSRLRKGKPEQLDAKAYSAFLRPTRECDYTSDAFRSWKTQQEFTRERKEGEVQFAQRVFQQLAKGYQYLYVPGQNRQASVLCRESRTDCGGLSTLFTCLMRSEGIPARVLVGRWAESARVGETVDGQRYYKYHVIAEFFAQGVGWVPVDPASAVLHDRTATKQKFFGRDPANFITLHVDTGVTVDTLMHGDYRADYFQIPLFWVSGSGSLDDKKFDEVWRVSTVVARTGMNRSINRGGN